MSYLAGAAQIGGVMVGAPLVIGMTRQVRARWEGRAGAGLLQPWRDLLKQLGKQQITPAGTTIVFAAAPVIVAGTTLLIAAIAPLVATGSPLDPSADLFAVVGLLFLGTVALTLAGIDTGTSFGGMGASREITIAALVEPTILLAVFALSIPAGSANLGALVASTIDHPGHVVSLAGVLAFVALVIVIVAETGRLPVDNPATHLELTMVHEAMVLEYAGPRLALVEWAAGMRLTVLLALLANLFLPWGIAGAAPTALDVLTGVVAVAAKVAILAVLLATFEVFLAKLRLFRVPELLAGSFLLALLAVTAANFFTVGREGPAMSNANFSILVDFAAGGLVLASVLIVWRRDLRAIVRLLAWQGAALAAIPLLRGIRDNDRALIAVGIAVLALRALVLPWLLARAVGAEAAAQREATPLVNTASSLLITAGLTLTAFAITQPVVNLEPGVTINAVPAAFAVVLIALFVMTTRLHAVSQAAGFLMLDNGIAATAFLLTAGVPLIVELGASLDVLFAVIVIGVLTGRLRRIFGDADLDKLRELRD
ncbi:formate hydrogenlyase hycD [Mycobacterium tuberculosis]|nr:formate hydrogenlyase hycD [Mycobacterium tuberculosis]